MIRRIFSTVLLPLGLLLAGCSDDIGDMIPKQAELTVSVTADNYSTDSKAIIEGSTLTSGSIGLSLLRSSDDGTYDNQTYNNLQFTYSSSTWTCGTTVYLSNTSGNVYAYYPYNSSASITAVPIDVSTGSDYMWATPVTVSQTKTSAPLQMNHALACVYVTIKKGTYKGTGKVTAFTWSSATAGKTATMNAKNGGLTSKNGGGTAFNTGASNLSISTAGTTYSTLVVPTGTAGAVTFNVTMDGQAYSISTTSSVTFAAGNRYNYTVVMDAKEMSLGGVTVTSWNGVTDSNEYKPVRK